MRSERLRFRDMESRVPPLTARSCLFLDVDGTLIEFAPRPSEAVATPELRKLLMSTAAFLEGALALVSGRTISTLDLIFSPITFPAAGLHGGEIRSNRSDAEPGERPPHSASADARLDALRASLQEFAQQHCGVEIEDKAASLAAHYRARPDVRAALERLISNALPVLGSDFHALPGSMVIEVKPKSFNKAQGIRALMERTPFRGRIPIFIGDDLTDLDGFRFVESCGGVSISVGDRVRAQHAFRDPQAVQHWLQEFVD